MVRGLTGFDRSGLGYLSAGSFGGEGGGDGVEAVERKVGPRGTENIDGTGESATLALAKSSACDCGREDVRIGWGRAIMESSLTSTAAAGAECGSSA